MTVGVFPCATAIPCSFLIVNGTPGVADVTFTGQSDLLTMDAHPVRTNPAARAATVVTRMFLTLLSRRSGTATIAPPSGAPRGDEGHARTAGTGAGPRAERTAVRAVGDAGRGAPTAGPERPEPPGTERTGAGRPQPPP